MRGGVPTPVVRAQQRSSIRCAYCHSEEAGLPQAEKPLRAVRCGPIRHRLRDVMIGAPAASTTVLLVWKIDRLARQFVYSVTAANDQERHGIQLRSVTGPIDTA